MTGERTTAEAGAGAPARVCWFVGLTTLDVVHRASAPPGRNQKITASRQDVAAGGPAANAAVTAAALGVDAVLVSALGDGPVAAAARADLEAHGVTVVDVAGPGFSLAVSAVLVDEETGERSVTSPDGALAVVPAPPQAVLADLPEPDVILFDGHHPMLARAVLAWLATTSPPPLVVLDAGRWRPIFAELVPVADVVAASADFTYGDPAAPLPAAAGPPVRQTDPSSAMRTAENASDDRTRPAAALLAAGARAVVTTHGAGPVTWRTAAGDHGAVVVPQVDARDTLGAGDAFHGALVAALAGHARLPDAISRAAAVASARVGVVGPRAWLTLVR